MTELVSESGRSAPISSESASFRVVSGGQTGVDRAALDAAMVVGIPVGGWCPRGRRSEDGVIPPHYPLQETPAYSYVVRTEWNIRDSDGTLVVVLNDISSGTRMTIDAAQTLQKPLQIVHLLPDPHPGLLTAENSPADDLQTVVSWIRQHKIRVLNVAGPRGSSSPQTYSLALTFLMQLMNCLKTEMQTAVSPEDSRDKSGGQRSGSEGARKKRRQKSTK